MSKNKINRSGIVYSTDPSFRAFEKEEDQKSALSPAAQKIKVKLETKHRAGKMVTIVDGFEGSDAEKDEVGKKLKSYCGTGGSVKEGEILVQGDNRDKVLQWLLKNGFVNSKKI